MPMDATAYWENRRRRNLAGAGGGGVGFVQTSGPSDLGMYHIKTGPEAAVEAAEISAAAQRYGANRRLEEAGIPRTSHSYQYDLTPAPEPTWEERAKGGPVAGKLPYIVGERGPELMVPEQNGRIIPNHKLQAMVRRAVPRADGGPVQAGGARWVGRQSLANAGQAARLAAEVRLAEDKQRAEFFKNQNSPEKISADAAREAEETVRFKAQALALYPGPDGKPDPRASQLIDLYTKTGMHLTSPQSAMEGIEQGMKIHKVVDSWGDGTKLAQLQGRLSSEAVAAIKSGNPTAILAAEERGFGNKHGLDPGVLAGKVKGSTLPEKIGQGVTPEVRAKADEANKTGLQHIGGKWLNYTTDANGQRQYKLSPEGNAPVAPKTVTPGAAPAPAIADPAIENWRTAGQVIKAVGEAPGNLIEAGLIRPINRAAEGIGSLAVQGARQLVPGAYKVFNEPTPTNPYGLQDAVQPAPAAPVAQPNLAIPVGPRRTPLPVEEPAPTFYP